MLPRLLTPEQLVSDLTWLRRAGTDITFLGAAKLRSLTPSADKLGTISSVSVGSYPNLQLIIPFGINQWINQAPSKEGAFFILFRTTVPHGCPPDSSPTNGVAAWEQLFYDGDRLRAEVSLFGRCFRGPFAAF